jgi:purine-binding chemotaxis protein CheW
MSRDKNAPSETDDTWHTLVASDPLVDFFVGPSEQEHVTTSYGGDPYSSGQRLGREMAELLVFWVGDEEYAIDILEIQELIKLPPVTPVPRTAESVLGIISLRGTIVPVLELSRVLKLGTREATRTTRVLVLRAGGDPIGLVVDRVTSVVRIERESIEPVPRTMQTDVGDLLSGVGRVDDPLLIIHDLPGLNGFKGCPHCWALCHHPR